MTPLNWFTVAVSLLAIGLAIRTEARIRQRQRTRRPATTKSPARAARMTIYGGDQSEDVEVTFPDRSVSAGEGGLVGEGGLRAASGRDEVLPEDVVIRVGLDIYSQGDSRADHDADAGVVLRPDEQETTHTLLREDGRRARDPRGQFDVEPERLADSGDLDLAHDSSPIAAAPGPESPDAALSVGGTAPRGQAPSPAAPEAAGGAL